MTNTRRPTSRGWTILVVGAAALLLAACGRKGPLDLPPTSSAPPPGASSAAPDTPAAQPSLFNPNYGTDAPPAAAKGAKRPFLLDPLLDSK